MAARLSRGLEEMVTCPICFEQYQDPRVLPCLHTYCKCCLERLLAETTTISCPECRSTVEIQDVNHLRVNFQINNLTSLLEGEQTTAITKKASFCREHKEELKLFCERCEEMICCECVVVDHKSHEFGYLKEIAKRRKAQLREGIKKANATKEKLQADLDRRLYLTDITEDETLEEQVDDLVMDLTRLESVIAFKTGVLTRGSEQEIISMSKEAMSQLSHLSGETFIENEVTVVPGNVKKPSAICRQSQQIINTEMLNKFNEIPDVGARRPCNYGRPVTMVKPKGSHREIAIGRGYLGKPLPFQLCMQRQGVEPDQEMPSSHENMMQELHAVINNTGSRSSMEPEAAGRGGRLERRVVRHSFPNANVATLRQKNVSQVNPRVPSPHVNMMNELRNPRIPMGRGEEVLRQEVVPKVLRPHQVMMEESRNPRIPMGRGEEVLRQEVVPKVLRPHQVMMEESRNPRIPMGRGEEVLRQEVVPKVLRPHEVMMKELHTVLNVPESQSPCDHPKPPMTEGRGLEGRVKEARPSSFPAANVGTLRERFERNVNLS